MILQVLNNYKELLAICQQILACVNGTDAATVALLQQQMFALRWQLATICVEAESLRQRLLNLTNQL